MIAQLVGKIALLEDGHLVLDVGGVGFAVNVPATMAFHAGDIVTLYTYLQVRENDLALYGFTDVEEKQLFVLLLGVSGVGPRAALSLMSTLSPDTLRLAILNGQPEVLSRAPGVGKKTGEAIVLHLKDKLKRYGVVEATVSQDDADVIAALTALGFSIVESQRALQQLPHDHPMTIDEMIRQALTYLGR